MAPIRLTNAGPFIEDENQRDIRTRISERRIDWEALHAVQVTDTGKVLTLSRIPHHSNFYISRSPRFYQVPSRRKSSAADDPYGRPEPSMVSGLCPNTRL